MNFELYLFCGGVAIDQEGRPKPLMKLHDGRSLISHYLSFFKLQNLHIPRRVTLLCDSGQEKMYMTEVQDIQFSCPINIHECGQNSSTFEKFSCALRSLPTTQHKSYVQFGYPDIFFFGENSTPTTHSLESETALHISAAPLTSRFPRLSIDPYSNEVKGISNYNSLVPANPMYVFGGDIWGKADRLLLLVDEFSKKRGKEPSPSLEYDFFFWLINEKEVQCITRHGERLWIDSFRDVQKLLTKMGDQL